FSVSKDPQRHILNGVYLAMEDGLLKMVSTDGRRLAYIFEEVMNAKTKKKAIVPTAGVNLILKIISGDTKEENIKMGLSENQIGIAFDDIVILSVLIEGSFPNYEQVIAPDNDGFLLPRPKWSIVINNKEMLNVIKRFKAMTDDDFIYGLFFSFDKNILKVSATATGIGCVEYEVTYIDKPGEIEVPFETSLNSEYIGDVLKNIEEDFSVFEFSIPSNPVLIRPQGNKKYLCVVMPMKMDI
ncbi:MAG: DNA polymerase III subunit beta, partial [Elusimicrobiota bacterium]|nr:DNA polymerase III subunit beta [Elusimicrobiota bacterium]